MKISKGTWTVSPKGGAVVTDDGEGFADNTGHSDVEYYGGFLIAESILKNEDAKLIAAAPDLLEALIILKKWVGKLDDWRGEDPPCELIDKAIDKATK